MSETYAFATDIHGNMESVDRFLDVAEREDVDHVVFGGDIAPKRMAIALADGQGVIVGGKEMNVHFTLPAGDIERAGHILFPSTLTGAELKHAVPLARVLSKDQNIERISELQLNDESFAALKNVLVPVALEYLNGRDGSLLLRTLLERDAANGMAWAKEVTPKEIADNLLLQGAFSNLAFHGKATAAERSRVATGNPNASREDFAKAMECMRVVSTSANHALAACFAQHMPWHAWQRIERSLDQHAVEGQIRFVERLLERIADSRSKLAATFSIILGNDDAVELVPMLDDAARAGRLIHATNRVVDLDDRTQMLGYSFVPRMPGVDFTAWFRDDGVIASELADLQKEVRSGARLLANIHCPPSASVLSLGKHLDGQIDNFGSPDVRAYLDAAQPDMLLTGHIHEPYTLNGGKIAERSGKTVIVNPGASERTPRIAVGTIGDDHPILHRKA